MFYANYISTKRKLLKKNIFITQRQIAKSATMKNITMRESREWGEELWERTMGRALLANGYWSRAGGLSHARATAQRGIFGVVFRSGCCVSWFHERPLLLRER